jgi:hypothetical protein
MDLGEIGWEDMNWMHLDEDRDRWRAFVNMVAKFCFHKCGEFLD